MASRPTIGFVFQEIFSWRNISKIVQIFCWIIGVLIVNRFFYHLFQPLNESIPDSSIWDMSQNAKFKFIAQNIRITKTNITWNFYTKQKKNHWNNTSDIQRV